MKNLLFLVVLLAFSLTSCANSPAEHQHKNTATKKFATGDISTEAIKADKKFLAHHSSDISEEDLELIKSISQPITITTYFGLWCHDSKREVPQLLDLLKAANNPNITHQLIALDIQKKEPKNRQELDNIKFTPTIIIKKDDKEIGRIVEKPKNSLAVDITSFLED